MEVVDKHSYMLKFLPDHFKTQKMCKRVVDRHAVFLFLFYLKKDFY